MKELKENNNRLCLEGVSLEELAAKYDTPLYLYSKSLIKEKFLAYHNSLKELKHLICYSVKANANSRLLAILKEEGAGADIVSGGELFVAKKAGILTKKIVFSGVGKQYDELQQAVREELLLINIESAGELALLSKIAKKEEKIVDIAVRINPDLDVATHPYLTTGLKTSKFGLNPALALELYQRAAKDPWLNPTGLSTHIGSQIMEARPFIDALKLLLKFIRQLEKFSITIDYLDLGGGLGVGYCSEQPITIEEFCRQLTEALKDSSLTLILEPGRSIIAEAGILLSRVIYNKRAGGKHFCLIDAAMNDLMRPALYQAEHPVVEVVKDSQREIIEQQFAGPVCESGDILIADRKMPKFKEGELLAILDCGAYGYSMASNYNMRCRPAEVLVEGKKSRLIRARESYQDLVGLEEQVT